MGVLVMVMVMLMVAVSAEDAEEEEPTVAVVRIHPQEHSQDAPFHGPLVWAPLVEIAVVSFPAVLASLYTWLVVYYCTVRRGRGAS
jgi:hypothetical protein